MRAFPVQVDARPAEELTDAELLELQKLKDAGATLHYMSALADIGVSEVKATCCDLLLSQVERPAAAF